MAAVNVGLLAVSVNSVLLMWSPPYTNSSCPPVRYIIAVTSASLSMNPSVLNTTYTANVTNKIVCGLVQGLEYSFTVTGVDAGGRLGENSAPSTIIMDSQFLVEALLLYCKLLLDLHLLTICTCSSTIRSKLNQYSYTCNHFLNVDGTDFGICNIMKQCIFYLPFWTIF